MTITCETSKAGKSYFVQNEHGQYIDSAGLPHYNASWAIETIHPVLRSAQRAWRSHVKLRGWDMDEMAV